MVEINPRGARADRVGPLGRIVAALDWFAPGERDPEELRRTRLLVVTAFGLCVFALPLMAHLYLTTGSIGTTIVAFWAGSVLMAANPFLLRRTGSRALVGRLVCLELIVILGVQGYSNGGPESAALLWNLAVPLVSGLLVGPRFALGCTVIVVIETITFYAMGEAGFVFPRPLNDAQMRWWHMAGLSSVAAFGMVLAGVYEASRKAAHAGMHRAVERLTEANGALATARDRANEAAATKARFLANMSHEIRTPMNAVIGMTDLLLHTELDPRQQELADTVRTSGDALLGLVSDILDFSKLDAGEVGLDATPVSLEALIADALGQVAASAADKGLELTYYVDPRTPEHVMGDLGRLRQVLLNLLSNAVKFTEHGEVSVHLGTGALDQGQHTLTLEVRDTGIGIPEDRIDTIFDVFTQADASATRRYGGTGLGLAIVRQLVELMGGRVEVDSTLGSGSTFTVTLTVEPAAASPSSPPVRGGELEGKRVLIVDDNVTNRRLLGLLLEAWDMHSTAVASAAEAQVALAEDPYDVLLLDFHMPDVDGLQLAAALREDPDYDALPIVMLTSVATTAQDVQRLHIQARLTKPIRRSMLHDVLVEVLGTDAGGDAISAHRAATTEPLPGMRVLLVEDNQINRMVALAMLETMGIHADCATNGLEAIESVKRHDYDVVLMDLQMPELDGLQATRRIRAELDRPPVIIALTANAQQQERQRCLDAGMADFIAKPMRSVELGRMLARHRSTPPSPLDRSPAASPG